MAASIWASWVILWKSSLILDGFMLNYIWTIVQNYLWVMEVTLVGSLLTSVKRYIVAEYLRRRLEKQGEVLHKISYEKGCSETFNSWTSKLVSWKLGQKFFKVEYMWMITKEESSVRCKAEFLHNHSLPVGRGILAGELFLLWYRQSPSH